MIDEGRIKNLESRLSRLEEVAMETKNTVSQLSRMEREVSQRIVSLEETMRTVMENYAAIREAIGRLEARMEGGVRVDAIIWHVVALILGALIGGAFSLLWRHS